MNIEPISRIAFNEKRPEGRPNSKTVFSEVTRCLPSDLLIGITILLQDTGYVTIRPKNLVRADWYRLDRSVKNMGGVWVRDAGFSHWSIPLTRSNS